MRARYETVDLSREAIPMREFFCFVFTFFHDMKRMVGLVIMGVAVIIALDMLWLVSEARSFKPFTIEREVAISILTSVAIYLFLSRKR
jgi:hypothetical protein